MDTNKKLSYDEFCNAVAKLPGNRVYFKNRRTGDVIIYCSGGYKTLLGKYKENNKLILVDRDTYKPKTLDDVISFNKNVCAKKSKREMLDDYAKYLFGIVDHVDILL